MLFCLFFLNSIVYDTKIQILCKNESAKNINLHKLPKLKYNTEYNRTWYPYRDTAIKAIEDLKIDNRFKWPAPFISTPLSLFTNSEENYEKMRSKTFYGCVRKMYDEVKRKLEKDKVQ